jgi:plasmid maintenance system antidote protein VapI
MADRSTLTGSLADAARAIPDEHWAYLKYQDSISDSIYAFMEEHDISKAELARALGTSRAYITKVLRGDANMTMQTFVSLLHAMGAKAVTRIVPAQEQSSLEQEASSDDMALDRHDALPASPLQETPAAYGRKAHGGHRG